MPEAVTNTVSDFYSRYPLIQYKRGEILLHADEVPHGVCYIEKGVVRQYAINGAGETLILQLYRSGSFIPMTWVINHTPNRYFFEAATDVFVRRAPQDDVKRFIDAHPDVLTHFVSRLLMGISGLWSRIEQLVLESAYAKTILLILYYAAKFGVKDAKGIALELSPTHKEIAAWIGTTRETASLQIEALKKKKLLVCRGRQIIIPSLPALEKELSSMRPDRPVRQ